MKMKNAEDGRSYLAKLLLMIVDGPLTIDSLAAMLFHITQMQKIPLPVVNAIHLVAFLLVQLDDNSRTSHILGNISLLVEQRIDKANNQLLHTSKLIESDFMEVHALSSILKYITSDLQAATTATTESLAKATTDLS